MRRALLLVAPALSSVLGCAGSEGDDGDSAEAALAGAGASGRLVALEPQPEVAVSAAPLMHWQVALGEPGRDVSSGGVASDAAGNAVVAGYTLAPLVNETAATSDAFVVKYSLAGELLWSRTLSTPASDAAAGVSCDAPGNVFVAGDTSGDLDGTARGFGDAFVAKLSAAGELLWLRQLGTSEPDAAVSASADARGNVFIAGFTRGSLEGGLRLSSDADVWVAKYSPNGDVLWVRQLGSSPGYDELPGGVSVDRDGDVLVAGHSFGDLAGPSAGSADAFVAKLSAAGELLWVQQHGGADHDAAEAISADPDGNALVVGQRGGSFVGGPGVVLPGNPFIAKYSPAGELLWESVLDAAIHGSGTSVTSGSDGQVWLAGYTAGSLAGPNLGSYDSFVAELSAEGELLGALQLGHEQLDRGTGISLGADGALLVTRDVRGAGEHGTDQAFLEHHAPPAHDD